MTELPASIDETLQALLDHDYVAERSLGTALFLALKLQRPLFLEGEPGTGKTEIAKTVAAMLGRPLIRLQCHEGLDQSGAAYEWNYARQMMEIRLGKYWGPMAQMAQNIQYTVDDSWFNPRKGNDDSLLNERYTGPIVWPVNWRDDVADLDTGRQQVLRCEAGQSCPREGWWFTPAKQGSRRHFKQGEVMPAFSTDYGSTIWQWDKRQGA